MSDSSGGADNGESATHERTGPVDRMRRAYSRMRGRLGTVPVLKQAFSAVDRIYRGAENGADARFDKRHGTRTSGVIPVAELDVPASNRELAVWYQPMSVAVFDAIMDRLDIEFPQFTFVDFGSGMGRVLLLASEYGFAEVIGVEFSRQLHDIALHNADIYTAASAQRSPIRAICMDATEFELPEGPLVLFFFSPFMGRVLEQVIQNVERSFAAERRPIVLVYHGANTESISAFQASSFAGREMHLNLGWFTPVKYRTFVFTNGFAADAEA